MGTLALAVRSYGTVALAVRSYGDTSTCNEELWGQ